MTPTPALSPSTRPLFNKGQFRVEPADVSKDNKEELELVTVAAMTLELSKT